MQNICISKLSTSIIIFNFALTTLEKTNYLKCRRHDFSHDTCTCQIRTSTSFAVQNSQMPFRNLHRANKWLLRQNSRQIGQVVFLVVELSKSSMHFVNVNIRQVYFLNWLKKHYSLNFRKIGVWCGREKVGGF